MKKHIVVEKIDRITDPDIITLRGVPVFSEMLASAAKMLSAEVKSKENFISVLGVIGPDKAVSALSFFENPGAQADIMREIRSVFTTHEVDRYALATMSLRVDDPILRRKLLVCFVSPKTKPGFFHPAEDGERFIGPFDASGPLTELLVPFH